MYCKYCGKRLDDAMEVCTECEEKLIKGENPFFSVPVYRLSVHPKLTPHFRQSSMGTLYMKF